MFAAPAHLLRRCVCVAAVLAMVLMAFPASVGNAEHGGEIRRGHSGFLSRGPSGSGGRVSWDEGTGRVELTVVTTNLAANTCVTAWFDWSANGHHDARALRVCRSNVTVQREWADDAGYVTGANRLTVCYTGGGCTNHIGNLDGTNPSFCNGTTGSRTVRSDGSEQICTSNPRVHDDRPTETIV
jgi:hypothetical protein